MDVNRLTFNEIASIKVGINLSRGKEFFPESSIYTLKDQEIDLVSSTSDKVRNCQNATNSYSVKEGEIIINLGTRKCSIVSKVNEGKIIKNSFAKIELNNSYVNPWFLCYFINESPVFKESISTEVVSIIRPLSVAILATTEITLPSFENQQAIGVIYHNICRISYLNKSRNELLIKVLNKIQNTK